MHGFSKPAHGGGLRARALAGGRRCAPALLLLLCAYLAGCDPGPEPRWAERQEEAWEPEAWRASLRSHSQDVEEVLPTLTAAAAAETPHLYEDTLRSAYHALQTAEESVPPTPWGAPLPLAELHSKYGTALRELRWGTGLMLDGLAAREEARLEEARYFIARGSRTFGEVRDSLTRPVNGARPALPDTAPAGAPPPQEGS